MQKTIGILAVLLAAQLVLAVSLSFTTPDLSAAKPDTPLFDLGEHSVERLTIEGPDQQRVVLAREGENWVLPQLEGFPADRTRVDGLLNRQYSEILKSYADLSLHSDNGQKRCQIFCLYHSP